MLDVAQFFPQYKKENIETKYYNLFAELRLTEMLQSAQSSQYYTRCNNKCFLICSRFFCLLLTRDKNGYCFFNFFFNLINFEFVQQCHDNRFHVFCKFGWMTINALWLPFAFYMLSQNWELRDSSELIGQESIFSKQSWLKFGEAS